MSEIRFTRDHEWVRLDGDTAVVGITQYAAEQLGDVVFVELPEVGRSLQQGKDAAVVESVKAASDVYAPVSGDVTEANTALADEPAAVNEEPQGKGWFFKMSLKDKGEFSSLMDEAAYKDYLASLD